MRPEITLETQGNSLVIMTNHPFQSGKSHELKEEIMSITELPVHVAAQAVSIEGVTFESMDWRTRVKVVEAICRAHGWKLASGGVIETS